MAPLPVIPDVYRVALHWTNGAGITAVNVLHFQKASSSASAVATAVDANVTAGMWASIGSGFVQQRLDITPLDGGSATYSFTTSGAKWTGGSATDPVPSVAQVVKLTTGMRGPQRRGRIFLGPLAEGVISFGSVATATVNSMQTAWNTFLSAMTTAGFVLVVASYKHGFATNVATLSVEQVCATQRRRQSRLR